MKGTSNYNNKYNGGYQVQVPHWITWALFLQIPTTTSTLILHHTYAFYWVFFFNEIVVFWTYVCILRIKISRWLWDAMDWVRLFGFYFQQQCMWIYKIEMKTILFCQERYYLKCRDLITGFCDLGEKKVSVHIKISSSSDLVCKLGIFSSVWKGVKFMLLCVSYNSFPYFWISNLDISIHSKQEIISRHTRIIHQKHSWNKFGSGSQNLGHLLYLMNEKWDLFPFLFFNFLL